MQASTSHPSLLRHPFLTQEASGIQSFQSSSGKISFYSPSRPQQFHLCKQQDQETSYRGHPTFTAFGENSELSPPEKRGFGVLPPTPISPADEWWLGSPNKQTSSSISRVSTSGQQGGRHSVRRWSWAHQAVVRQKSIPVSRYVEHFLLSSQHFCLRNVCLKICLDFHPLLGVTLLCSW